MCCCDPELADIFLFERKIRRICRSIPGQILPYPSFCLTDNAVCGKMTSQFPPAFLLNIIVEPDRLDVNIHPTKNEVKLRDEHYAVDLLTQAIKKRAFSVEVK